MNNSLQNFKIKIHDTKFSKSNHKKALLSFIIILELFGII